MAEAVSKKSINAAVLTVSDTRTAENDTSGDYLCNALSEAGHVVVDRQISKDDLYKLRLEFSRLIADESIHVIVSTGGTGFSARDNTPEAISPLLDTFIDGFGELFRAISYQEIGSSTVQSRALAGVANNTLVICVPGSAGACKTAWEKILAEQLDSSHAPCNFIGSLKLNQ